MADKPDLEGPKPHYVLQIHNGVLGQRAKSPQPEPMKPEEPKEESDGKDRE